MTKAAHDNSWVYCRQPFPYRITEELSVTRAKSEASSAAPKSWTLAAFT